MDFGEGNDLAEIDLTYSPLRGISRARRVLGRPIVCIIQVQWTCANRQPITVGRNFGKAE